MALFEWGCQLGIRLGGTIIVERRFVNIVSTDLTMNTYMERDVYTRYNEQVTAWPIEREV